MSAADACLAAHERLMTASRRLREANDAQDAAEREYRIARELMDAAEARYYRPETVLAERARPDHR